MNEIERLTADIAVREALLKRVLNEKYSDENYIDILCDIETLLNPPAWYKSIPKKGLLCRVRDCEKKLPHIAIISEFCFNSNFPFTGKNGINWRYATPLTNEEIEAFKQ